MKGRRGIKEALKAKTRLKRKGKDGERDLEDDVGSVGDLEEVVVVDRREALLLDVEVAVHARIVIHL